jgi:hypothetical protein
MRTQGEIEAAVSEGISRFEQDYMGQGPKDNLCLEIQVMNEYEVTYVNGDVFKVEAWLPIIAQAIAEEDAGLSEQPISVASVKLRRQPTASS